MTDSGCLIHQLLDQLSVADPELAEEVGEKLGNIQPAIDPESLRWLVDDAVWGLSIELSFGREIAMGYARLIAGRKTEHSQMRIYRSVVREFGKKGPTVGRIMATHLPFVLLWHDDNLLQRYLDTFNVMYQKGGYTLKGPLECASVMLNSGDLVSGFAYLSLLYDAFSQDMSYNRSLQLTYTLPKAVGSFPHVKRVFHIKELSRVIKKDISLAEVFLEGLEKGLNFLSRESLERFVLFSLDRYEQDPLMGRRFLSLASKLSSEMCSAMQVAAPLFQVQHRLIRYMRARTGLNIAIKPVSSLSLHGDGPQPGGISVFSDGNFIYLPDEINIFDNKEDNSSLYWHLVRLESGQFEFGTFEFDFEKALARCSAGVAAKEMNAHRGHEGGSAGISELDQFFQYFPHKGLATAMFTIYEHGRIRLLLSQQYPGLVRRSLPIFQNEASRLYGSGQRPNLISTLYARIALGMTLVDRSESNSCDQLLVDRISDLFEKSFMADTCVETSAALISLTYDDVFKQLVQQESAGGLESGRPILETPFGRFIRPDLVMDTQRPYAAVAVSVREKLRKKGIQVYKSDLRKKLVQNRGALSPQDIQDIIVKMGPANEAFGEIRGGLCEYLAGMDWFEFHNGIEIDSQQQHAGAGTIVKYPEWDCRINDYLDDHVRVMDRHVPGCQGTFYSDTLRRYQGLIKKMRRAFEMLKPEGLAILRQWIEGDQFDYRALLDFAIDRKVGRIPSDRLYIKRVKQQRDIAVLVLVDLSRSTANKAADSSATVLDIEKEAIVLFSEALGVVGDRFAIAGFSGTGRFGVDYLRIKDFSDAPDEEFHRCINAMIPQRSTRMGAAIRHAVSELEKIPAKVRVLMTIGDGFPNDVGYKQGYAIADTRKAVHEAYSKRIYFKALTINIAGDPKLDDLYGSFNHNVISDIRELPDKLLWIYSTMTKM